jgi:hypothetical protein
MKTTCLLFLTMSWGILTTCCGAPLRAEPALECGSGAAAFDWGACSAAGTAVAALPHSTARTFGPRPLPWGVRQNSALSPLGERVARAGVFTSRRGTSEGVPTWIRLPDHSSLPHKFPWAEGVPQPAFSSARQLTGTVRSHSGAASQKVNRPEQLPNNRQRSIAGNPPNVHKPGSNRSATTARSVFGAVNNALPVRTLNVVRPSAPSFNNVRHRSPNPAVVSGSTDFHSRNTGAINGTRMNRKP